MTVEFFQQCVRYARAKTASGIHSEDIASEMYLAHLQSANARSCLRQLFIDALRKETKWHRLEKKSMNPLMHSSSVVRNEYGDETDIFETLVPPGQGESEGSLDVGTIQTLCTKLGRLRRLDRAMQSGHLVSQLQVRRRALDLPDSVRMPTRSWDAPLPVELIPAKAAAPEPKRLAPFPNAFDRGFKCVL